VSSVVDAHNQLPVEAAVNELWMLAQMDGADMADVGLLGEVATAEPGIQLAWTDTDRDGLADERQVTMVSNTTTFCVTLGASAGDTSYTLSACR